MRQNDIRIVGKEKTYSSCYLKYATEIVLLKLIAVVNNTSPVSSPAL